MFNQRKNKRYSYKPRTKDSIKTESKDDLEAKWSEIRDKTKQKGNVLTSLPVLIIALASLFVLMYILNRYI